MMRSAILAAAVFVSLAAAPAATAWTWPADGPVLQGFALGADPYAAGQHRGIDIGGTSGDPVRAPAAGRVSYAGTLPHYGRSLTIRTDDGWVVTLLHLGTLAVARGAVVSEGQTVATLGVSGEAEHDGPSVHLGIRHADDDHGYVDPAALLPSRAVPAGPEPVAAPPPPAPAPATPPPVEAPATAPAAPVPAAEPAPVAAPVASDPVVAPVPGPAAAPLPVPAVPAEAVRLVPRDVRPPAPAARVHLRVGVTARAPRPVEPPAEALPANARPVRRTAPLERRIPRSPEQPVTRQARRRAPAGPAAPAPVGGSAEPLREAGHRAGYGWVAALLVSAVAVGSGAAMRRRR